MNVVIRRGWSPGFLVKAGVLTAFLVSALAVGSPAASGLGAGHTERADVTGISTELVNGAYDPSVNTDGRYVAFDVRDPNDGSWMAYLRDRETHTTNLVIADRFGDPTHGLLPAVSGDGHLVAFWSNASNIVPGDTNGLYDVFVRDMVHGVTQRIDVGPLGEEADNSGAGQYGLCISRDGTAAAFTSDADNLVAGGSVSYWDVFVRDLETSTTVQASVDSSGNPGNSHSYFPSLSSDGRYCAFSSDASNLTTGDVAGWRGVFVHDVQTGLTERADVATDGGYANANSDTPSISGDGRYVGFKSNATNLVATDTAGADEIYVYDRVNHTTRLVSMDAAGAAVNGTNPSFSANGRYLSFRSYGSGLIPGQSPPNSYEVYVYDMATGTLVMASVNDHNAPADNWSGACSMSGDGQHVVFGSYADNLVPNDTNGQYDVFVRDFIPVQPAVAVTVTRHIGQAPLIKGGQTATLDVVVSNSGPLDLKHVPLSLAFDSGVWAYSSSVGSADSTSTISATWNDVGPLAIGQTTTVTVVLTALAPTGGGAQMCTATVAGAADYYADSAATVTGIGGVSVDTSPPTATLHADPASNTAGWNDTTVTVTLDATDGPTGSGVAGMYYTIDGTQHSYTTAFPLSMEGTHTVKYWSVDVVGNIETSKTATFKIDTTPPELSVDAAGPYTGSATIHANPSDALSGLGDVKMKLDVGSYSTAAQISTSMLGPHTVYALATDKAGNQREVSASFTVVAPPVTFSTTTKLSGPPSVKVKKTLKLTGTISPSASPGKVTITMTRLVGKKWKSAGSAKVSVSAGKFSYSFKPKYKGSWRFIAAYSGGKVGTTTYKSSNSAVRPVKVK